MYIFSSETPYGGPVLVSLNRCMDGQDGTPARGVATDKVAFILGASPNSDKYDTIHICLADAYSNEFGSLSR